MITDVLTWSGWNDLTVVACAVGLVGCLLLVIEYHRLTGGHWRDEPEGRWLMHNRAILVAIFSLVLSNRLFGDWPGRLPLTAALMITFAVQTFTPYRLLLRAQREVRHEAAQGGMEDEGAGARDVRGRERGSGLDRHGVQ